MKLLKCWDGSFPYPAPSNLHSKESWHCLISVLGSSVSKKALLNIEDLQFFEKAPANRVQVVDKVENARLCEDYCRHYHCHLCTYNSICVYKNLYPFYDFDSFVSRYLIRSAPQLGKHSKVKVLPLQSLTPSLCRPQWTRWT